jgi:hypothetical protein
MCTVLLPPGGNPIAVNEYINITFHHTRRIDSIVTKLPAPSQCLPLTLRLRFVPTCNIVNSLNAQNSDCNIDTFLITKLDQMPNTSLATLAAWYMTAVNCTAEIIQPEASAFAHYCKICLVWYLTYLLTPIGLPPGGSCTIHIYTQTIHRTTQNKQYIEQHKIWAQHIIWEQYKKCTLWLEDLINRWLINIFMYIRIAFSKQIP